MNKILIIDDDEELCDLVAEYLSVEGFETKSVNDGDDGLREALSGRYEIAVLDVMLPKMNGFDVLRELRKTSGIPVLMLTARGDDMERIVGLEIGADDYLSKPFNPRELVARLRAILRRVNIEADARTANAEHLIAGDLEIAPGARTAKIEGREIVLTTVEFELLAALVADAGNTVRKEDLSRKVLDRDLSPFDRSLDMHISNLRKKLGPRDDGSDRIKTIRSVGYIYTVV